MSDFLQLTTHATLNVCRIHSLIREGRAVRRLVTLVEPISDMITEHDHRQLRLSEGASMETIQAKSSYE